jgi:hypothetical protein
MLHFYKKKKGDTEIWNLINDHADRIPWYGMIGIKYRRRRHLIRNCSTS